MLQLDKVCVNYGKSRVDTDVSFNVGQDDCLVLLGRNGVGKTTLMKSIIGLLPLSGGTVSFQDKDVSHKKAYERSRLGIAYVPQGREIIPMLTVQENLELGGLSHNVDIQKKMDEIFEYFPMLTQHLHRKGGVLSGGQQQQLAIARALMGDPSLLILDEPTEGIQPNIVMEMADTLVRYHKVKNVPLIVVEQNLHFARRLGNRFLIMQKGTIVCGGKMEELTDELSQQYLSV